jgi:nitric oxide reductase activation protein
MKSMRSGRLDTNKIAEAAQQVPTIYERFGQVTTSKVCVGVLIDESGSMGGSKIEKAREAAIFINEVFRKMPDVELFIYGHTADITNSGSVDMMVYREKGFITDSFSLGSVSARANNRDGDAIFATAKRMRAQTENQGLLFVLSDGAPSASDYGGRSAIDDTRKKVLRAQSLGFQVIQIAIEEHVPSRDMFDYFIKMTDIKNLPKELVAYMSRKVDKLIKEKVTV